MRAVSVFPLDEFRLALKKVYGAAAPKGPFTALSQATLFFSRNSCTIACCNLNQWCQATIPAQGDEFSLTLYDTQRLLDACAYFSGELHLEYETAEKKPHNCDIPYNQARFSCGGREIHQLVFDSDLYQKSTLSDLYRLLETYTLDPVFERYGEFVNRTPCWIDGETARKYSGASVIAGNFLSYSHAFYLITDQEELIRSLERLIEKNRASPQYQAARARWLSSDDRPQPDRQ